IFGDNNTYLRVSLNLLQCRSKVSSDFRKPLFELTQCAVKTGGKSKTKAHRDTSANHLPAALLRPSRLPFLLMPPLPAATVPPARHRDDFSSPPAVPASARPPANGLRELCREFRDLVRGWSFNLSFLGITL